MAARDENSIATSILCELDATVSRAVNETRTFVDIFKRNLEKKFPEMNSEIKVSLTHGGSAYEGLAVNDDADCDITVLLGKPFELLNFHPERDDGSKYFTLRWKSHHQRKTHCDSNKYLRAAELRSIMLDSLQYTIKSIELPNVRDIEIKQWLTSLAVKIELNTGRTISIDVVPQIVFRSWNQCPDLKRIEHLPKKLRQYIDTLNKNKSPIMCFALAVPDKELYSNGDNLFNISFSLLEKEYFKSNTNVRDMVRLVKFISDRRGWKGKPYKFKSFYAKRVAIKNDSVLTKMNLWDGFHALLSFIRSELHETGTIDGFFVDGQVTYKKDRQIIEAFIEEIDSIIQMPAEAIKGLLTVGNLVEAVAAVASLLHDLLR